MKVLVYSDGRPSSVLALHFAAALVHKLDAELAVIMVRSGTHAIEPQPPLGVEVDLSDRRHLPPGLQVMAHALEVLSADGLFDPQKTVQIRELSNGHMFVCQTQNARRVPFYVCFGHMIEVLNHEIDKHRYDLLIIAPPRRGRLHKMMLGDTTRKLVLDVHTSILIVRGGRVDDRFVVCADGSAAAKRQFPMLRQLLPLIQRPLELVCVQTPDHDAVAVENADRCLEQAQDWLKSCGKAVQIHRLSGVQPAEIIASLAGDKAVILVSASLRHDIYRRLVGSMPMQILARSPSSVLVVKGLPEGDPDVLQDSTVC